jgi:hypothetical protein
VRESGVVDCPIKPEAPASAVNNAVAANLQFMVRLKDRVISPFHKTINFNFEQHKIGKRWGINTSMRPPHSGTSQPYRIVCPVRLIQKMEQDAGGAAMRNSRLKAAS